MGALPLLYLNPECIITRTIQWSIIWTGFCCFAFLFSPIIQGKWAWQFCRVLLFHSVAERKYNQRMQCLVFTQEHQRETEDRERWGKDQVLWGEAVQRMKVLSPMPALSCYWFSGWPAITIKISKGLALWHSKLNWHSPMRDPQCVWDKAPRKTQWWSRKY